MKLSSLSILLIAFLLSSVMASAQEPIVYNKESFANITYTWTDDAGVQHTSTLAEPAVTYRQMCAFIGAVNKHREIPGTKQLQIKEDGTVATTRWTRSYQAGALFGMTDADKEPIPYENAPTLILGKAKDNWRSITGEAWRRVESLEILYARTRVEGENPGWVFEIESSVNFFFLLSKGRLRENPSRSFWGDGFEELSPTGEIGLGEFDADTHNRLARGEMYPIEHDCSIMTQNSHYFGMSGIDGTTRYLHNLLIFLPDKRILEWDGRDLGTQLYTYYHPDHLPYLFDYTINLTATLPDNLGVLSHYQTELEWQSSFKKVTGGTNEATFTLYRIDDDDNMVRVPASEIHLQGSGTVDAEGNIRTTDLTVKARVDETRGDDSQQVRYVVRGRATDMVDAVPAQSNQATVFVAGKEALTISIARDYHAQYEYTGPGAVGNLYVNDISLRDNAMAEEATRVTRAAMQQGARFDLYRIVTDHAGTQQEPVRVASITVTDILLDEANNRYLYKYEMAWEDDAVPAALREEVAQQYPFADTAEHALTSPYTGDEAADRVAFVTGLGDEGIFARLRDICRVEVAGNAHPQAFSYSVTFVPAGATADADNHVSNYVTVPSIKTDLSIDVESYSREQLLADTRHELAPTRHTATFSVLNNLRVLEYHLMRSDDAGATYRRAATAMQIGSTPDYYVQTVHADGTQREEFADQGAFPDDNTHSTTVTVPLYENAEEGKTHVLVNIVTQPAGATFFNSYGSDIAHLPQLPGVEVKEVEYNNTWNTEGIMENIVTLHLALSGDTARFPYHGLGTWRSITNSAGTVEKQIMGLDTFSAADSDEVKELGTTITIDEDDPSKACLTDRFILTGEQNVTLTYTVHRYNGVGESAPQGERRHAPAEERYLLSATGATAATQDTPTSIDVTAADNSAPRYYTLQGVEIPEAHLTTGLYIRVSGHRAERILLTR